MFIAKQKYILLLVFLLFPAGAVNAAWSEPSQPPTGGNAAVPVYSEGVGQTLVGTLHVDPSATNAFPLQANGSNTAVLGTGTINGLQGVSVANALFGSLTANAAGGGSAVYGLAVDGTDYAFYASGGIGIGLASGEVWFTQRNTGVSFPHVNSGAYGNVGALKVLANGETQIRSLGNGINFLKVTGGAPGTLTSLAAISEAGAFTVGGVPVCLQNNDGCPAPPAPPGTPDLQGVTSVGSWTTNSLDLRGAINNSTNNLLINDWVDVQWGLLNSTANNGGTLYVNDTARIDTTLQFGASGDISVARENVFGGNGLTVKDTSGGNVVTFGVAPPGFPGFIGAVFRQQAFVLNSAESAAAISLLETGDINNIGDYYITSGKSLRVDNGAANTTLYLANYGEGGGFVYGSGRTASLQVDGDVRGNQLCFQADCRSSWSAVSGAGGWTDSGANVYLTTTSDKVGIGTTDPGTAKLAVIGGNVGIGINSPVKALDVRNEINIGTQSAGGTLYFGNDTTSYNRITYFNNEFGIYSAQSNGINFYTSINHSTAPTFKMGLNANGNFGIGLSPANYKLDVSGSANATSLCIAGTCKTGWATNSGLRQYKTIFNPPDGQDVICDAGYVMVGIRNTAPQGQIICDRIY